MIDSDVLEGIPDHVALASIEELAFLPAAPVAVADLPGNSNRERAGPVFNEEHSSAGSKQLPDACEIRGKWLDHHQDTLREDQVEGAWVELLEHG